MIETPSHRIKRILLQIAAFMALACALAVGVNHWRSDGIALVGDWSVATRFADGTGENARQTLHEEVRRVS